MLITASKWRVLILPVVVLYLYETFHWKQVNACWCGFLPANFLSFPSISRFRSSLRALFSICNSSFCLLILKMVSFRALILALFSFDGVLTIKEYINFVLLFIISSTDNVWYSICQHSLMIHRINQIQHRNAILKYMYMYIQTWHEL